MTVDGGLERGDCGERDGLGYVDSGLRGNDGGGCKFVCRY